MDEHALRNFKDFLVIYNQMAELCFSRCVHSLGQRNLSTDEESCVDKCASKHVNINHKMMSIYMEVQPQIVNKRNEELQQQLQQQPAASVATQDTPIPEASLPTDDAEQSSIIAGMQTEGRVAYRAQNLVDITPTPNGLFYEGDTQEEYAEICFPSIVDSV